MKIISIIFLMLLLVSCASSRETNYTASTPAAPVVKLFLGIPITDSIDFIRWKLTFNDGQYSLQCNYGIVKPNTNGFINGGKKISLNGVLKKEGNHYRLYHNDNTLRLIELNTNLLHLLDADNSMLVGNGGWSYTINNTTPLQAEINITPAKTVLKDSMIFEGRTSCAVPGIVAPGTDCYKLKWYITLYANSEKNEPGAYKILGTPWRQTGSKKGNWKISTGTNGRIIYQLNDEKGNGFIYLLKAGENIFLFTDEKGTPLVGNEDFSYTLNRKL